MRTVTDDAVLVALVRAHHDRVFRYGQRVCRDGFDADDAVQEAFVKLARRPEVADDRGVVAWLFTVVRNACRRLVRRARPVAEVEDVATTADDPRAALERYERVRVVHEAIASLDPAHREVLIMRDLEGRSGEETCRALGIETAAMKSRLHRARAQLRERIR